MKGRGVRTGCEMRVWVRVARVGTARATTSRAVRISGSGLLGGLFMGFGSSVGARKLVTGGIYVGGANVPHPGVLCSSWWHPLR